MAQHNNKSDEISWLDLQNHLLWWVAIFNRIRRLMFSSWKQNRMLYYLSMGLSLAFFILYLYGKAQTYQVKTTFVYGDLHPKIFGDMVGKLNALINNKNWGKVASLMQLSPADARKISSVKAYNSRGKSFKKDYSFRKEPMIIEMDLKDSIEESRLKRAIVNYLNSNPFTADRLELKKKLYYEELAYIDKKMNTIDSVLNTFYSRQNIDKRTITIENSQVDDTYELLKFSRELMQRKSEIENSLVNPENIFAIDNFIILPKAKFGPGSIIKYGLASQIFGFCFAFFLVFWRKVLSKIE